MRVFVFGQKEKKISVLIAALMVAALFSLPWVNAKGKMLPIYRVGTDNPKVAVTFDVAWEGGDLDDILTVLKENDTQAAFFITGDFARRLPNDVMKIDKDGHIIGNHSDSHPHVAKLSAQDILKDAGKCDDELKSLTGKQPIFYRTPYGEYNNTVLSALEKYKVIQWDVDSLDWKPQISVGQISNNVLSKTKNGSIILFHVGSKSGNTAEALKGILPELKEKFDIVPLTDLIPSDNYYINVKGELIEK